MIEKIMVIKMKIKHIKITFENGEYTGLNIIDEMRDSFKIKRLNEFKTILEKEIRRIVIRSNRWLK